MELGELANTFPDYASPGNVTSALIAKMLASKMPGGFGLSAIKEYLSSERSLPSGRVESILLHGLSQSPKQRLSDEAAAKKWLDGVVDDYAKYAGIAIPYLSKLGGVMAGPAMGQQAMRSRSLPSDFEKRLKTMIADQVDALNAFLGEDKLDWHRKVETEVELREGMESSMAQWVTEHGELYSAGVVGKFDPKKERLYDSYWNWALQDAMALYHRTATGRSKLAEDTHLKVKPYLCSRATPELVRCVEFFASRAEEEGGPEGARALRLLAEQVAGCVNRDPVHLQLLQPTQPQLRILENGELEYAEVPREAWQTRSAMLTRLLVVWSSMTRLRRTGWLAPLSTLRWPVLADSSRG
jgi:fatty acid synthase subunit alpha